MAPKTQIIVADYQGFAVSFTDEGWFNATAAAAHFGRRVDHYLANSDTKEYIAALSEDPNTRQSGYFMKTQRGKGGGTWLHPDLAVHFARWLDIRFAIWCDRQSRSLLTGEPPVHDQTRLRN